MRLLALPLVAFACHASPPPKLEHRSTSAEPTKPVAEPVKTVVAEPEPSKPSCATVGAKLLDEHGYGKIPDDNKPGAKRGFEAEVLAACVDDRWPDAALDCMTTRPSAISCVGQLTTYQQKSFDLHLKDWERKWRVGAGEEPIEEEKPKPPPEKPKPPPTPREEWVSCELKEPAAYAPAIDDKAHARDLAIAMRERALETQCYRWGNPDKKCFNAARDAAAIQACRDKLDEHARTALANTLGEVDDDLKKIATLEKTPKAIACKVIAELHYNDDAWHGRVLPLPAAERKRLAVESRAKMTKSCTDDKWTALDRACLVARGGGERAMSECFPKRYAFAARWGYPPAGVSYKTGVAECDVLGELVNKLATCDKLEADMRDMLQAGWGMEMARFLEWHGARDDIVRSCKQTGERYREFARDRGCSL
jgi:hypothetical protein